MYSCHYIYHTQDLCNSFCAQIWNYMPPTTVHRRMSTLFMWKTPTATGSWSSANPASLPQSWRAEFPAPAIWKGSALVAWPATLPLGACRRVRGVCVPHSPRCRCHFLKDHQFWFHAKWGTQSCPFSNTTFLHASALGQTSTSLSHSSSLGRARLPSKWLILPTALGTLWWNGEDNCDFAVRPPAGFSPYSGSRLIQESVLSVRFCVK